MTTKHQACYLPKMALERKAWLERLRMEASKEQTDKFYASWCAEIWGVTHSAATFRLRQLRKLGWVALYEQVRYPAPQPAIYQLTRKGYAA